MTMINEFNQSGDSYLIGFRQIKRNCKYICAAFFCCWFLTNAAADNLRWRNIIADSNVAAVNNSGSPVYLAPGVEKVVRSFSHNEVDKVDFYRESVAPSNFICELTVEEHKYVWFMVEENYQPQVYLPTDGKAPCVYWSSFPQREWSVSLPYRTFAGPDFSYVIIYPAPFKIKT